MKDAIERENDWVPDAEINVIVSATKLKVPVIMLMTPVPARPDGEMGMRKRTVS